MKKHIKTIKISLAFIGAVLSALALLSMPEAVTAGVKNGLFICSGVLIPSLFPFLILSGFLSSPAMAKVLARLMGVFTKAFFKLPGDCGSVIILSVFAGFPIGGRMTSSLYRAGVIRQDEAVRLMRFCVNAGPAFLITAVGSVLLGSLRAGLILFASTSMSLFLIGMGQGLFVAEKGIGLSKTKAKKHEDESLGLSLTRAVSDAIPAMLSICGWLVLFSCLHSILNDLVKNAMIKNILSLFLEVSLGIKTAAQSGNIPLIAFIAAFGGFCVHFQLLAYLQDISMSYLDFFIHRVLAGFLSFFTAKILLYFYPTNISRAVSTSFSYRVFSVSAPASLALLFLSFVFICSFSQSEFEFLNIRQKSKSIKL